MKAANVGDTLKTMTNGQDSAMGSLLKSGDVGKAAQMACAVLSLVDNSEGDLGSNDRKSVRLYYLSYRKRATLCYTSERPERTLV